MAEEAVFDYNTHIVTVGMKQILKRSSKSLNDISFGVYISSLNSNSLTSNHDC